MNGEEAFERGKEFYEQGEYLKAIECFEKALEDKNFNAPGMAWKNMGIAYWNLGKHEKSIECYEEAIEAKNFDEHSKVWYDMGIAHWNLGKYKEAIDYYEKAIGDKKFDALGNAWNNMGIAYENLGEHEKAIDYYEKAIKYNPEDVIAYNNLGKVLYRLKRYDDAEKQFRMFIKKEKKPKVAEPHYNLGVILTDEEFYEDAKKEYEIALELEPKNADCLNGLGYVLSKLGYYKKAKEKFEEAISSDQTHSKAHHNLRTLKKISETKYKKQELLQYGLIVGIISIIITTYYLFYYDGLSSSEFSALVAFLMGLLTVTILFPELKYIKVGLYGIEASSQDIESKPTPKPAELMSPPGV